MKNNKYIKQLESYFNSTPKERLDANYERIHKEFGHGVIIDVKFSDDWINDNYKALL